MTESRRRVVLPSTPAQTIGPFFGFALPFPGGDQLAPVREPGAIRLHGTVRDGAGVPVPDALLEIWQPDPTGAAPSQPGSFARDGHGFTGWGRVETDRTGHYSFQTLRPGPQPGVPHSFIAMVVFARGLLDRLHTRIYLPAEAQPVALDALLAGLTVERRRTLLAVHDGVDSYRFDVRLQGEDETVFLDFCGADNV